MRTTLFSAASIVAFSVVSVAAAQPAQPAQPGGEATAGAEVGAEATAEAQPAAVLGGPGESCQARADCAEGLGCVQQVCTDPNQGKACGASSECGGQLRCIENVCGGPEPKDEPDEGEDGADGEGSGFGNDMPIPYVKRPLTLPAMTLAPEFSFDAANATFGRISATVFAIDIGAAFGITDDLTVELMPLSFYFGDPPADYGAFRLAAIYRFLGGEVAEIGAKFRFSIDSQGILILNPGLPVRLHLGDMVRIDTGLNFDFMFPTQGGDAVIALGDLDHDPFPAASPFHGAGLQDAGVPLDLAVQIVDFFWAGLTTGFGIASFEDAGDTIFVPLGFEVGGTVPGEPGPLMDITAGFQFPYFIFTGHPDTVFPDLWELGINAKAYIGL